MDEIDINGQTVVLRRRRSSRRSQRLRDSGCYPLEEHEYAGGVSNHGVYNGVAPSSPLYTGPALHNGLHPGSTVSAAVKRRNRGSVCIVSLIFMMKPFNSNFQRMRCGFYWYLPLTKSSPTGYPVKDITWLSADVRHLGKCRSWKSEIWYHFESRSHKPKWTDRQMPPNVLSSLLGGQ